MQLTKQTDFAFRTLIYLGSLPEGQWVHVQDVCDYYDISPNHVSKVIVKLAKLGYVDALRGKGGGICLRIPPSKINLARVVEQFETILKPANCIKPRCKIFSHCKLKGIFSDAMSAFIKTLDAYTLADLLEDQGKIKSLGL